VEDLPPTVWFDRLRIAKMVSNLLSNAVTHGDPHLPIELISRHEAVTLDIGVRNGGSLIPKEAIAKLFLPFESDDIKLVVQGLGGPLHCVRDRPGAQWAHQRPVGGRGDALHVHDGCDGLGWSDGLDAMGSSISWCR